MPAKKVYTDQIVSAFVHHWNSSNSTAEAATKAGLSKSKAAGLACRLRKFGCTLKFMPIGFVDHNEFVEIWNSSAALSEAAKKVRMKKHSCRTLAVRLRKFGVSLKYMPRECSAIDAKVRFWEYVQKSDNCWTWTGCTNQNGYGQINADRGERRVLAHRLSYEIHYGEFDASLNVCHHCDNPPCVRPDHLFLGTDADNAADCVKKGRSIGRNVKIAESVAIAVLDKRVGGMSYESIAEACGVSVAWVYNLCNGKMKSWLYLLQTSQ